jgi:hypothetical protein
MKRRDILKGSAIVSAVLTTPVILKSHSALFASKSERKVYRVLTADKTMVGTLSVL